jgi:hypothetical protein
VLTDRPPDAADAGWYGRRAWIERGFKRIKRGGRQWRRTRMTDPARAGRLWPAVAVATLWPARVGSEAEDHIPESTRLSLAGVDPTTRRHRRATRVRLVSRFRRGWAALPAAPLDGAPFPPGRFHPEPRPAPPTRAAPAQPSFDELLEVA